MSETSVSNLNTTEKKAMCGAILDPTIYIPIKKIDYKNTTLPEKYNWHNKNGEDWMTPVRSQRQCGSCWAFGAIGSVEATLNIAKNNPNLDIDLSEQELVSKCCTKCGDCGGGDPRQALEYIKNKGIVTEDCFPYTHTNTPCTPCNTTKKYNITNIYHIKPDTTEAYKKALLDFGPLTVVIKVPEDWFYYAGGVYEPTWTTEEFGWANHVVVLCGWNDTGEYWIIKNSWGKYWGIDGYAYVRYGNIEKYGYAFAVSDPVFPAPLTEWVSPVDAVAESEFASGYGAEKAIDENIGTFWFSDYSEKSTWIKFDLGDSVHVDRVRLMIYERDVPMDIKILDDNDRTLVDQTILVGNEFVEIPVDTQTKYLTLREYNLSREFGTCTEFQYHKTDKPRSYIRLYYENGSMKDILIESDLTNLSLIINNKLKLLYNT